jgi:hypothetical protein
MTAILLLATITIFRMGGDIDLPNVPNGAALRTMGGDIHIGRAAGRVIAKTMGGNIEIRSLDGSAEASTMGGDVRVSVDGRGAGHDVDLYSLGGEIELVLPADFDGDFTVELEEGDGNDRDHRVISDFPLTTGESTHWRFFGGRHVVHTATGRIGSGANRVRITTIGSDIRIRKR